MLALLLPKALWCAALAVPLILLYVLKTRRTEVRVSSAMLFAAARREAIARDPWRRLRPEVSLLVQLLALLLLVLALARPAWRGDALDADAIVIVVDRSASMATTEPPSGGGPEQRFSLARRRATELLDHVGLGTEVAVIAAERKAKLLAPLGRDLATARRAIAQAGPLVLEGDLEPALDMARDLLRQRSGRRRVVVYTDLVLPRAPSWVDEPGGPALEVVDVAGRTDPSNPAGSRSVGNVGIVRLDVRRVPAGSDGSTRDRVEVGVVVAAHGALGDRTRYATLRRIDRPTALDARKIDVRGPTAVTLGFTPAPDDELAVLAVELSPEDDLAVDDWAHVVVPPSRTMPVTLASLGVGGSAWLARALAADPEISLSKTTPDRLAAAPVEPWSMVIVSDACPTVVPGGGDVLIVNPPPGQCAGRRVGDAIGGPELPGITSWSASDPRLRYVDLGDVHLGRVVPLAPLGGRPEQGAAELGPAALIRSEHLAVAADASTLDRRVTLWGFDPGSGDLVRKTAFVLMVRSVVDTARLRRDQAWAPSSRSGAAVRVMAAPHATEVVVRRMAAPAVGAIAARAPVVEGVAMIETLEGTGPFSLEGAATSAPLAASLLSDVESSIDRRVDVSRHQSTVAPPPQDRTQARMDLRWLFAALAALLLAFDACWLTTRRSSWSAPWPWKRAARAAASKAPPGVRRARAT